MTSYYENENVDRAVRSYFKRADREGATVLQPCNTMTHQQGKRIYICNGNSLLGVYKLDKRGIHHVELTASGYKRVCEKLGLAA